MTKKKLSKKRTIALQVDVKRQYSVKQWQEHYLTMKTLKEAAKLVKPRLRLKGSLLAKQMVVQKSNVSILSKTVITNYVIFTNGAFKTKRCFYSSNVFASNIQDKTSLRKSVMADYQNELRKYRKDLTLYEYCSKYIEELCGFYKRYDEGNFPLGSYGTVRLKYLGGLPAEKASDIIADVKARRYSDEFLRHHAPATSERHIAVEIEAVTKMYNTDLAILFAKKIPHLCKNVQIKNDASIRINPTNSTSGFISTAEIVYINSEANFREGLYQLCNVLKEVATVNSSCGLHVHLDMRFKQEKTVVEYFKRLYRLESLLYKMQPPSRSSNMYCEKRWQRSFRYHSTKFPTPKSTLSLLDNVFTINDTCRVFPSPDRGDYRYYGINTKALTKYRTIELRMHSGSINAFKIDSWVQFLLCVIDQGDKITRPVLTRSLLVKTLAMEEKQALYLMERVLKARKDRLDDETDTTPIPFSMPVIRKTRSLMDMRRYRHRVIAPIVQQETENFGYQLHA